MDNVSDIKLIFNQEQIRELICENTMLKKRLKELENNKIISDEELICIKQIEVLKNSSDIRDLSLDEVKRLDLLVKNLRLIRENKQKNDENEFCDLKEADLVAIATSNQVS